MNHVLVAVITVIILIILYKRYSKNAVKENLSVLAISSDVKSKPKLILYYTPNCPFCVQFKPIWEKSVVRLSEYVDPIAIDCSTKECAVAGFPTIRLYTDANYSVDFDLERTSENLLAFVKSKLNKTS